MRLKEDGIGYFVLAASVLMIFNACSPSNPPPSSSATATGSARTAGSSDNTCRDFPVPIYPSTTSNHCEESNGHPSAYLASVDSVDQVTKFYETQVQSTGWKVKPDSDGVNNSTHAVVTLTKGKGYASVIINTGAGGKGSDFQIHAYPKGNN